MHNNNINALRFVGAFLVLFGHSFELTYGPGGGFDPVSDWLRGVTAYQAKLPGIGVALFFVLSGYLVTRSFENRHNLIAYVEARVLRIFPALWMTLLFTVFVIGPAVSSLELSAYFSQRGTWNYLLTNARLFPGVEFQLPGVFLENPWSGGVNGSLWTLPVELRMYIIVAVFGSLGFLRRSEVFNLAALLIVAWYFLAPDHFVLLQDLKHERLGVYFLLGALFYMNREKVIYHWAVVVVLSVITFLAFGSKLYDTIYNVWFSYLVLYISFHKSIRLPDLGKHGDFSYGLYLYAFPMTQLSIYLFGAGNPWLTSLVTFLAAMVMAAGSWFLVERPSLRLKGMLSQELARALRYRQGKLS